MARINYRLLSDVWRELQTILGPAITRSNQQEWRIELNGGGVVEMWSLDSPDSVRGRSYAVAVIDECAMVPDLEPSWQRTIRPMLTDHLGGAWFLSTPKGMNYFKIGGRNRKIKSGQAGKCPRRQTLPGS